MEIQEKVNKVQDLYIQQKEIFSKLTIENYFDSAIKIRSLELQKETIKAIPTSKINTTFPRNGKTAIN